MIRENKETYAFLEEIPAGATVNIQKRIEASGGRVKKVLVIIPDGPDGYFKIYPRFLDSKGIPKEIVSFVGSVNYLSGNDVTLPLYCDTPIEQYSKLDVTAVNEGLFAYPLQCFIEIEYLEVR